MSEDDTTPAEVMANAVMLDGCQECGLPPGWLVIDCADPDVIDRVARALCPYEWETLVDFIQDDYRRPARDIFAALGEAS